jgi:diphthine-ammonia ligase
MSFFVPVNKEYIRHFSLFPPSRSCVATTLPTGVAIAASAIFQLSSYKSLLDGKILMRRVLHIQSLSSWAPLCIGPYSQANVLSSAVVFLAGQIALDPNVMLLVPRLVNGTIRGEYMFRLFSY